MLYRTAYALGLIAAATLAGAAPARAGALYDAVADFSQTSNPNGVWSYGYGTGGSSFTAYDSSTATCAGVTGLFCWYASGADDNNLPAVGINTSGSTITSGTLDVPTNQLFMHPTGVGATSNYDTIVQFTAPTAGGYAYSGLFQADDAHGSTGVTVSIWDGSTELFSALLGSPGATANFSGIAALGAGGTLEFVVTASNPYSYDSTGLEVLIPEPATAAVFAAGLALLGVSRRRRASLPA